MKVIDKLMLEFDKTIKLNETDGPALDDLTMLIQEFSRLYEVKKYILVKELV